MKLFIFTLVLLLTGTEALALSSDGMRTKVICEEGHKFLIVWNESGKEFSVTQIKKQGGSGGPEQPMKCEK